MNYRVKIAEHPEYADALVAMFGTDDVGRISEQDARLFWHYVVPEIESGYLTLTNWSNTKTRNSNGYPFV